METVTEQEDFAAEKRAERKRPPPKPAKAAGSSSSKQDDRLVARVLHLARERTPLAQIDGILSAEGANTRFAPQLTAPSCANSVVHITDS